MTMTGIIILISLLTCALCLLIALFYIRHTEIEVTDKSIDLGDVLPIQTITEKPSSTATVTLPSATGCFCPKCSPFRKAKHNISMSDWKPF